MAGDAFGLIGKVLGGQFRVDELVGEGGFSVVYKGFHMGLREPVAVKCLRLPQLEKRELADQFSHRFRDESRIAYRLSQGNLNIVRSITSGTTQDARGAVVPYMVLEWLNGETLGQNFKKRRDGGQRGRSTDEVVRMFAPAVEALTYAHSHGVIHRDVKPQNLFLAETREGVKLKVLDFGMAKILSDGTLGVAPLAQSLGTTVPVFSPPYAAPEQFDWKVGLVGAWTDVHSLAIVMMEALTDQRVRKGESLAECMVQACDPNKKVRAREMAPLLGDAVDEILSRALSLKPKDRPQDMNEFWTQLVAAHKKDGNRGGAFDDSSSYTEDVQTAVTDTRALFADAQLGRPGTSPTEIRPARPFGPPSEEERRNSPSDAPTMDVPIPGRFDQTLVTAPPIHEGPSPTRTLLGSGVVAPPAPTPAAGSPAGAPGRGKHRPMTHTLMGVPPMAPGAAPAPPRAEVTPEPPPLRIPTPTEMSRPNPIIRAVTAPTEPNAFPPSRTPMPHSSPTGAATQGGPPRPQSRSLGQTLPLQQSPVAKPMAPDAAAPPVERPVGPTPYDSTEIVNTGAHYPEIMLGHNATAPQGAAALGTPSFGGAPAAPPGGFPQQPAFPQTAGYAPIGPTHPTQPSAYSQPGAYAPPPTHPGEGYVNVGAANAQKKPPIVLFVVAAALALFVILGIGVSAFFIARARFAAQQVVPTASAVTATPMPPESSVVTTPTPAPDPTPTAVAPVTAVEPAKTPEPVAAPTPEPVKVEPVKTAEPEKVEPVKAPDPGPPHEKPEPAVRAPVERTPAPTPKPPTATSAPKPAADPNAFNADAARSSLRAMEGILASCKKPDGPTGPGKVHVTFANSGAVQSAAMVGAPYEGTPTGDCALSRFRMARAPAFEGPAGVVDYAFKINK
jgi:serine/threonine protein kinase